MIVELIEVVLHWLASTFGVNGLAIGSTAIATAGLWYLREFADLLAIVSRYARAASAVMAVLLVVLVVGTVTGVLDLSADSSALGQVWRALSDLVLVINV